MINNDIQEIIDNIIPDMNNIIIQNNNNNKQKEDDNNNIWVNKDDEILMEMAKNIYKPPFYMIYCNKDEYPDHYFPIITDDDIFENFMEKNKTKCSEFTKKIYEVMISKSNEYNDNFWIILFQNEIIKCMNDAKFVKLEDFLKDKLEQNFKLSEDQNMFLIPKIQYLEYREDIKEKSIAFIMNNDDNDGSSVKGLTQKDLNELTKTNPQLMSDYQFLINKNNSESRIVPIRKISPI